VFMPSKADIPDVSAADLAASVLSRADFAAITDLCVRCSAFFSLVQGKPGGPEVAEEFLSGLAPGMGPESKHTLGFSRGGALVGALDLVDGYPEAGNWYVSLFFVDPPVRGDGLGRAIWAATERWIRARGATHARLVVQNQNPRARAFWESRGFEVIGETWQRLPTRENRVWRLLKAFPAVGDRGTSMGMTVDELVKAGDLLQVFDVKPPSDLVRSLGDAEKRLVHSYPMNSNFCYENGAFVVTAMRKTGEQEWQVVYGFAYWNDDRLCAHVWAKKGAQHFDPTWSMSARPMLSGFRYFALTEKHADVDSFTALKELGGKWTLDFY
jgi:ribosomal protein S18 acetylase RimI-like enzyme